MGSHLGSCKSMKVRFQKTIEFLDSPLLRGAYDREYTTRCFQNKNRCSLHFHANRKYESGAIGKNELDGFNTVF
jgi:hypothetical protein